ncbi:MAG: hypothetical protein JKY46_02655 [Robiginitomaculum sp.]|nr:hypothetical protein [Robiginitomaculum sp.]
MNQNISLSKNSLVSILVIGFMVVAGSSFASPKPTASDAQNFLKTMADNKMISGYSDPLLDYEILEPCKSTWKYASSDYPNHTININWANITSIVDISSSKLVLNGAVIITRNDKQEIDSDEWLKFPDKATRDRAIRAIQVIIDECDVLGDAFGAPIEK